MSHELKTEFKIDFHKTNDHVPVEIDINFPKAPCSIVFLTYRDILGQNLHMMPIKKYQLDSEGSAINDAYEFNDQTTPAEHIEDAKKYPGCRIFG